MRVLALLAILALGCAPDRAEDCPPSTFSGNWELDATDSRGGRLVAAISFSPDSARLRGTEHRAEGANEPLDYPLTALAVDSGVVTFRMLPSEIAFTARCGSADSLSVAVERIRGADGDPLARDTLAARARVVPAHRRPRARGDLRGVFEPRHNAGGDDDG